MHAPVPDISQLKQKMKETWSAGDFGVIARYAEEAEIEFVQRLNIQPGMQVLDVACGTGNTAIPAAEAGANVVGVDIAPNLIAQAKERARSAGVNAEFREGDAEALIFADHSFDVIVSVFGAMFAPRPEKVASEFLRVCRPGGRIAMGNWMPSGFVGKMFAVTAKHAPPPPGIPAPALWGDEAVVRERFKGASKIEFTPITFRFTYPFPPRDVVKLFRDYFGPTKVAFARLDPAGQQAFSAELERLWTESNSGKAGETDIPAEYLQVWVTP